MVLIRGGEGEEEVFLLVLFGAATSVLRVGSGRREHADHAFNQAVTVVCEGELGEGLEEGASGGEGDTMVEETHQRVSDVAGREAVVLGPGGNSFEGRSELLETPKGEDVGVIFC